jgi:hypothetical protein
MIKDHMKDLSKKIRNGGVQKFNGASLGVSRNGKGGFPRFNYQLDEGYKKNYDKIDWSK